MNFWTESRENIYVAGHRGWVDKYPENTMLGFRKTLELGVDQLETDIHLTKDGELVLIHDTTLDRTTNGGGAVKDFTLEEIRKLDAGDGEKIPTFREFMELVKDHPTITLDIELKVYPEVGVEAAIECLEKTVDMIEEYNFGDRIVLNTWSGKLHEIILEKYGNKYRQHLYFPIRHLGIEDMEIYKKGYCTCVFGVGDEITVEDVLNLEKETGIRPWAGTYARNEKEIDRAISFGAQLITCNNPDEVLEILRKKGLHK